MSCLHICSNHIRVRRGLPEGSINWPVPTDEGARGEEHEPEDGQAKVHATRRIHTEPGHAADHVGEQRPRMSCSRKECKDVSESRRMWQPWRCNYICQIVESRPELGGSLARAAVSGVLPSRGNTDA